MLGGEDGRPAPARIVLESGGKETVPSDPDQPRDAYTAARAAKEQGVQISTISFGTPDGYVEINDQRQPVPVDDETLQKITEITGGQAFQADAAAGQDHQCQGCARDRAQERLARQGAAPGHAERAIAALGGPSDLHITTQHPAAGTRPSRPTRPRRSRCPATGWARKWQPWVAFGAAIAAAGGVAARSKRKPLRRCAAVVAQT